MSALRDAIRELPDAVFADFLESDEGYVFVVDLPGATAETTEVLVEDGRIEIEGRREKGVPDGFEYVREDRPLFLDAELPLPSDADAAGANAEVDRGVLEVSVPKRARGVSRSVPVDGGEQRADAPGGSAPDEEGDA